MLLCWFNGFVHNHPCYRLPILLLLWRIYSVRGGVHSQTVHHLLYRKVFELSELAKALFRQGIRNRNPGASEEEIQRMYIEGLLKCHNRNY